MTQGKFDAPSKWSYPKSQQAGTAMSSADMAGAEERISTLWMGNLTRCSWSWIDPRECPTATITSTAGAFKYGYTGVSTNNQVQLPVYVNANVANRMRAVVWIATSHPANAPMTLYSDLRTVDGGGGSFTYDGAPAPIVFASAASAPPGSWSHVTQPWAVVPVKVTIPYSSAGTAGIGALRFWAGLTGAVTGLADPLANASIKRVLKIAAIKVREEVFVSP